VATAAVEDHLAPSVFEPRVAFGVLEVGAHFEKTARVISSSRNVPRRELVGLPHVDEIPARLIRFLEDLRGAHEAFLASTTREIQAVSAIDGRALDEAPGPRTREAQEAFAKTLRQEL